MPPRVVLHRVRVGHGIQSGGRQGLFQVAEPSCPSRTRSLNVAVASWSRARHRPGRCRRGWHCTVSESDTLPECYCRQLELGAAPARSMPPRVVLHRVRVGHGIQSGGRQGLFQVAEPSCPSRTRSRKVAVANWSWVPRRPGRCRRGWRYTVSESDTAFRLEVARACSRSQNLRVRVGHAPGRLLSPAGVRCRAGQVDAAEGGATPCPSRTRHSVWRSPGSVPGR